MTPWQDISTAPKDGTPIRAGAASEHWDIAWMPYELTYRFLNGQWCAEFGDDWQPVHPQPTHWMPLPEPPKE